MHEREGVSIRKLARRFRVHRRDVRRALASPLPPPRQTSPARPSLLDEWKPTIEAWLETDRMAPRNQRHTAWRVWERLRDEHSVLVGESTVRRYVTETRLRQEVPLGEVMVAQHHVLGEEAEVDFGTITVELAGLVVEVQLF